MLGLCHTLALGATPDSPEVQAMVKRGVAYIEANFGKGAMDEELGAAAICALACFKATGNPEHPIVQKAVAQCREEAQKGFAAGGHANYSLGIALIFLGELNPHAHRQEVDALLKAIYQRQRPDGAWSYPNYATGDTSQTQYACLGLWMAGRQDIQVSLPAVERVCNWLLRTQDPSGAFGYQGKDPGSFTRIAQERRTASMAAAGVGSLYVCGELLGFIDDPRKARARMRLPPAIRPVQDARDGPITQAVDQALWQESTKAGNNWFDRNAGVQNSGELAGYPQQFYYMYAVERYKAFQELAEGVDEKEPGWYNAGVNFLRTEQKPDGSWVSGHQSASIDTGFAILFLLRSSKATVTKLVIEKGRLTGGKGLNSDLSTAKVDAKGQVVTASPEKSVEELLKVLEDPDSPKSEYVNDMPDKLVLPTDPRERQLQLARLRRLVVNGSFQARLTAAKTLGTIRDLDSAPALIFALSDPDYRVVRSAENSLRFMSRKPDGFGFEITEEQPPKHVYQEAQKNWTNWLLSVKPDAELLE